MFVNALTSLAPHPTIPKAERIFEPFIGEWSLKVTWYESGRIVREMQGEWLFSRVLEGRGIQDVWIVPPRDQRNGADLYEYGTSVRFFDPLSGGWRSTWIGPMHGVVHTFLARREGETIVLESIDKSGEQLRWLFSDKAFDGGTSYLIAMASGSCSRNSSVHAGSEY